MRTIFITPLLWKKLDRAMRRRSEGQALVLIALTAVGMVAIVGLAIDSGLGFLDAQKVQRAADAAALAGAVWVPQNGPGQAVDIADARGKLAAQANGFDAVNYQAPDVATVMSDTANSSYQLVYYNGFTTGNINEYGVTIAHRVHRWFLGIIGIPDYDVQRSAVGAYSQLPRLGAANNYFGSSGILQDHDRLDINGINATFAQYGKNYQCDSKNKDSISWQGGDDVPAYVHYYCGMYLHYNNQACASPNAPSGNCLGTFWLGMYGTQNFHANGDAYNPAGDGGVKTVTTNGVLQNQYIINTNQTSGCTIDPSSANSKNTWYYQIAQSSVGGCQNNIATQNWPNQSPQVNFQFHPDAPIDPATNQPARGFGYEVAIDVNGSAIQADNGQGHHTALNVSIYNAAFASAGTSEPYFNNTTATTGTAGDGNAPTLSSQSVGYYSFNSDFDSITRNNVYGGFSAVTPISPGTPTKNTETVDTHTKTNLSGSTALPPDNLNFSRYTLYLPPAAAGTPTTWTSKGIPVHQINGAASSGNEFSSDVLGKLGSALIGVNLSYMNETYPFEQANFLAMPITQIFFPPNGTNGSPSQSTQTGASPGDNSDYNDQYSVNNYTFNRTGYWSNFCYIVDPTWLSRAETIANAYTPENYYYVCPPRTNTTVDSGGYVNNSGDANADFYWNQLYGSASRSSVTANGSTINPPYNFSSSKVVTGSVPMYITGTWAAGYGNNEVNSNPNGYVNTVDPHQACRTIFDTNWGVDRIPVNMRGSDWTTELDNNGPATMLNGSDLITSTIATKYYSYHGQRCSWDFDSSASASSAGPDFNPVNPTLAAQGGSLQGCNAGDGANLLDTPDKPSFANGDLSAVTPGDTNAMSNVICYEPYFHITNFHWENGNKTANGPTAADPYAQTNWLTGGTYLLHIQNWSGAGFHTYSVKAEYEYPKAVTDTVYSGGVAKAVSNPYPVPNVYALDSMTLYINAGSVGNNSNTVIFDLANIPSTNAGYTAVLELWDPGDVFVSGSNIQESLQILQPSGYGRGYGYADPGGGGGFNTLEDPSSSSNGLNTSGRAVTIENLRIYPFNNTIRSGFDTSNTGTTYQQIIATDTGGQYLNDQWIYMAFHLPTATAYNTYKTSCAQNGVPDSDCYYFQILYKVQGSGGGHAITYANDATSWELYIQNQPVHLVQ